MNAPSSSNDLSQCSWKVAPDTQIGTMSWTTASVSCSSINLKNFSSNSIDPDHKRSRFCYFCLWVIISHIVHINLPYDLTTQNTPYTIILVKRRSISQGIFCTTPFLRYTDNHCNTVLTAVKQPEYLKWQHFHHCLMNNKSARCLTRSQNNRRYIVSSDSHCNFSLLKNKVFCGTIA